jgi:hypothetical protein
VVVLFQEILIPSNAQRRIKIQLGTFHPDYVFYIEAGWKSRAQWSQQSSRWGSDLNQLKVLREVQSDLDEWSTREGERVRKLMDEGIVSHRIGAKMFLMSKFRKAEELISVHREGR